MSNSQDKSKSTPATIKIAAKDASQRGSGGTDPGPGDPEAQPSEMPEPVSIPAPPSPSELVVKSLAKSTTAGSRAIKTINDPVSLPKSKGSSASTSHLKSLKTAPTADENAPRESTSSKALSSNKMGAESGGFQEGASTSGIASRLNVKSVHSSGKMGNAPNSTAGGSQSRGNLANVKTIDSAQNGPSASQAMQADSMAVPQEQDVVEEVGQTEVEQPESPSPGTADQGASPAASQGSASPASSNAGSAQVSPSVGGSIKMQSKVLGHKGSSASREANQHHASRHKKKTSKFRYHKRVTVRTHGKTSPSTVMDKVNMKDHKAGLTPSSIGEMDQEELMKRAGIKGGKKTHWRVRLRQTKRTTKDGKTTTQTKVAYRDSEGNKRIKTSSTPECPKCGKKLEDCRCDE